MPLLLHLADIHLGARHAHLGGAAVKQRERQLAAFARAIDEGQQANVDAVLICGDLFDSNAQPRRSVERVVSELKRFTDGGTRVVIIPGSHDVYDSDSIYRAFDLASMAGLPAGSELLTLLTPERPELLLRDLDLIVYGRVFATRRASSSPLEGFSARSDERASWKVGMVHGSRHAPGEVERDDVSFTDAEIASSGLDYLALGHRHSFSMGRAGETTWAYPGAPEPLAADEDGAGSVCLVRLEDGAGAASSVHVERVRVGRTVFRAESVDASSLTGRHELVRRLRELADPDLALQASIDGIAPDALELDVDEVERELAPSFLHVRVRDRSAAELHAAHDLPIDTVAGKFVADTRSRLRAAESRGDAETAEQARQILRLGRRLLLDEPGHLTMP
jgi:DNA repair protein SbcD/Mre11